MNSIQEAIFVGSKEESGIWEVLNDISDTMKADRETSLQLMKNEIYFILTNDDIFLIKSNKLYDSNSYQVLDKTKLLNLKLTDVEFNEKGPFYYLSDVPAI